MAVESLIAMLFSLLTCACILSVHMGLRVYIGGQRECFFLFSLIVPIVDYNGFANLMT